MKRPVWRYRLEATTNAPVEVVKARLAGLDSALQLSACCPRLGRGEARGWHQTAWARSDQPPDGFRLDWSAQAGGLLEEAWFSVQATPAGCLLRAEGRLKGWPLLWKLPLLEWRSDGLIQRFVASL